MIKGGGKVAPDISSVRDTLSTVLPGRATDRPIYPSGPCWCRRGPPPKPASFSS